MSTDTGKFIYSTVNLHDPEPLANKKATLLGWVITFLIASWVCVSMRLWVRFRIVRAPGWDDFFVVLYLLTMTVGCITICYATDNGLGKHVLLLPLETVEQFLKTFYVTNATYCSSTCFIKIALLLQYLRVFERGSKIYMITLALTVFTALWGLAYSIIAWIPCVPVSEYWNMSSNGDRCWGYGSHYPRVFVGTYESHTAVNMVLDAVILILPVPLLWKTGTTTAVRVRLAGLLSMGCIVLILAAWRLEEMVSNQVATYPTRDPTWYGPLSILLAALEVNAASICASVPIFWPVFATTWSGIFVTQEVKVTSESRYVDEDGDSLTHRRSSGSQLSIVDSDGRHHHKNASSTNKHYRDSFILRQVDPLRQKDDRDMPSALVCDSPKDEHRKYVKF
ncbi:hypothetical protein KJ359_004484 [Pestalotiopsis sp. 9143b]|nr:hypothetical protein KJ359_004484 [Pestalotiopsis sp. 9143b]